MRILHSSTKKKQTAAQEQVQSEKDCFPYQKAYKNGIIRLADQTYAKMYAVPDTQRSADVKKMFLNLLVSFGTRIHIQQTAYCRNVAAEESVQLLYKFFIVSAEADGIDTARQIFNNISTKIMEYGANIVPLTQTFSVLYDTYHMEPTLSVDENMWWALRLEEDLTSESFWKCMRVKGMRSKEFLAPKTLEYFEDHVRVGDMYARVLKVEPFSLTESIISELMDLDFSTIISMHCDGMDGHTAERKGRKSWKQKGYDLPDSRTDESFSVMKNHFFSVTTTAVIFAEDKKQLDENTELFQSLLEHYCTDSEILYSPHLQKAGFFAGVPCGICRHLVSNDVSSSAFLFSE